MPARAVPGAAGVFETPHLQSRDLHLGYHGLRAILEREGWDLPANPNELQDGTYVPLTAPVANQIRLLIHALHKTETPRTARRLAQAIGTMHDCEADWWHACLQNRRRPRKVLEALALMYA